MYLPPAEPGLIDVPLVTFVSVHGHGDPNTSADFQAAMQAIYTISFGIKMLPKTGVTPAGYYEYTVFPPEGLWDIEPSLERARQNGGALDKSALRWSIMIRQPDFVTLELFEDVRAMALRKKDPARVDLCRLETITDGLSVQMMHIGPYDAEPASFARMDEVCCTGCAP